MRNLFLMLILSMVFAVTYASKTISVLFSITSDLNHNWEKVADNSWVGQNGTHYQIDRSSRNVLVLSTDNSYPHTSRVDSTVYINNNAYTTPTQNSVAGDGIWVDKTGKWFKLGDKKLLWSNDNGQIWREEDICTKWQGGDGNWYKFDKDLNVWVNRQ